MLLWLTIIGIKSSLKNSSSPVCCLIMKIINKKTKKEKFYISVLNTNK